MLNDHDTTSILCTNLKAVNRNFDSSKGATINFDFYLNNRVKLSPLSKSSHKSVLTLANSNYSSSTDQFAQRIDGIRVVKSTRL